jgi:hypothetical protein
MSASAIAPSGSIRKETTQFEAQIRRQDISNLAYALWQYRGRSEGSPEHDWFDAEQRVQITAFRRYRAEIECTVLHHSDRGRFLTDNRQFDTATGPVTALILNTPENSCSETSDQLWFRLGFSDGRTVMILVSDKRLAEDLDRSYQSAALESIQNWLTNGGPRTLALLRFPPDAVGIHRGLQEIARKK